MQYLDIWDPDDYEWDVDSWDTPYVSFPEFDGELARMAGCCGYALYNEVQYYEVQGITKMFIKILEANRHYGQGFGAIMCTVVKGSTSSERLEENGWKEVHRFHNNGSGNDLITFILEL